MKLREIGLSLAIFARGMECSGAEVSAAPLRLLANFLFEFPDRTTAELTAHVQHFLGNPRPAEKLAMGPLSTEAIPLLEDLHQELVGCQEMPKAKEVKLLIELLRCDSGYLMSMFDTLRRALTSTASSMGVTEFSERLNAAIGTEAFEQALSELVASKLKRDDVVEVARKVYGSIPKNTSRKAAIRYIRKPHDARLSAKRGIDAMGGRSAA